jgi:uncharacterized protein YbjQ (UPF0145 family)
MDPFPWLEANRWTIAGVAAAFLFLVVVFRKIGAALRRRRPTAPLHPKLARYAGLSEAEIARQREDAAKIIATSSSDRIAGYEIVRQIETVFVEGYRTSEEALLALKAAAGRLGATAVMNVSQQRTAAGRCSAQGDSVVVRSLEPGPPKAA